jgi:uncharacterized protein (UPF0332 family)
MSEADDESDEAAPPTSSDGVAEPEPNWDAIGNNLFGEVVAGYIEPELQRRRQAGEWPDDVLYRWQVLLPWGAPAQVRVNEEVGGTVTAKAARPIEKGEEVMVKDVAGITGYKPRHEDADIPHVTAFLHAEGWSIAFELGYRDPGRHDHLRAGQEFVAAAREALGAGRLRAFADNAFSAAELMAKAELLSSAPTVELALAARKHGGVASPYNLWARLGNTDPDFARLLNRLNDLRPAARYLNSDFALDAAQAQQLLTDLEAMAEHVRRVVEDPRDKEHGYQVIATREIRAGTIVRPGDFTLIPPRRTGGE